MTDAQSTLAGNVLFHPQAVALTIAGSDPSGGAGLQADLKTFQELGVYGMSVVTLLTVQNTQGVTGVRVLEPAWVTDQLNAVLTDIPPRAIKTGALGSPDIVHCVAQRLSEEDALCPLVVDPVLVSKHGHLLAGDDVVAAYRELLLPLAELVTPNRYEAERLTGISIIDSPSAAAAADRLLEFGVQNVLIKLGEVDGESKHLLATQTTQMELRGPRYDSKNTHGTGCILAAAITAQLARGEVDLKRAVIYAIRKTLEAIQAPSRLGQGIHPADVRAFKDA